MTADAGAAPEPTSDWAPIPGPLSDRLRGKVAIVTGGGATDLGVAGSLGFGVAICRLFAADGCQVVIMNRSLEPAQRTLAAIKRAGGEAMIVQGDVSSDADCKRVVAAALAAYGQLDILVNNAGLALGEDEWDQMMDVNLKGQLLMAKAVVPSLPRGGAIVNISSIAAFQPAPGNIAYATSKGAVVTLSRAMAIRWGFRGVRVNSIVPGSMWSPAAIRIMRSRFPSELAVVREKRRLLTLIESEGNGWDIAHAAAFLASDQARWITGESLLVDGGLSIWREGSPRHTTI